MPRHLKILLVEDCPDDVSLIECELTKAGFVFTSMVVSEEDKFRRSLSMFMPDVVLVDDSPGRFSAIEAFRLFQAHSITHQVTIPFILVTDGASTEFATHFLKLGVDDHVWIFALRALPAAIEGALRRCKVKARCPAYRVVNEGKL